ncbi:hypothetical protein L9F63_001136, partial [Diploptera punctata]
SVIVTVMFIVVTCRSLRSSDDEKTIMTMEAAILSLILFFIISYSLKTHSLFLCLL